MHARLAAAALAAIATALVVQPRAAGDVPRDPRPAIASADLLLRAGKSKSILHVPGAGWWTAKCGRISGHHRVVPEPPLEVVSQHWQIAPFASAHVRVTSADVVARALPPSGSDLSCAASVVAVTGPDQGPTREG